MLAGPHHADGGVGGVDRELQPHHAVLEAARDLVAHLAEDLDHPAVLRQDLGDELVDAALAAGLGEVLEQQLADPAALVGVLDQEGHLGLVVGRPSASSVILSNRPTAMILCATVSTNATRSSWSTWVKRSTSRAESLGIGAKNRMYFDSAETRA